MGTCPRCGGGLSSSTDEVAGLKFYYCHTCGWSDWKAVGRLVLSIVLHW